MQEVAEFEKQYRSATDQAGKDYKLFLNLLDEHRPSPYLCLKSAEVYENILIACNILNKVKHQILEMTRKASSARANATASTSNKGKNNKKEDKDEISSTILKMYDLTEFHTRTRRLYLALLREMMQNRSPQKWGFTEFDHWKTFQDSCAACLERVAE